MRFRTSDHDFQNLSVLPFPPAKASSAAGPRTDPKLRRDDKDRSQTFFEVRAGIWCDLCMHRAFLHWRNFLLSAPPLPQKSRKMGLCKHMACFGAFAEACVWHRSKPIGLAPPYPQPTEKEKTEPERPQDVNTFYQAWDQVNVDKVGFCGGCLSSTWSI